jgi:hypothetical protein
VGYIFCWFGIFGCNVTIHVLVETLNVKIVKLLRSLNAFLMLCCYFVGVDAIFHRYNKGISIDECFQSYRSTSSIILLFVRKDGKTI